MSPQEAAQLRTERSFKEHLEISHRLSQLASRGFLDFVIPRKYPDCSWLIADFRGIRALGSKKEALEFLANFE
ncbi:hypothetical protein KC953_02110 [Candidatus Saccharibacteria bacterium]|nr:hypothetical protein [Candidatus Saccharibacteria bacterium]